MDTGKVRILVADENASISTEISKGLQSLKNGVPGLQIDHAASISAGVDRIAAAIKNNAPIALMLVFMKGNSHEDVKPIQKIWEIDKKIQLVIFTENPTEPLSQNISIR